ADTTVSAVAPSSATAASATNLFTWYLLGVSVDAPLSLHDQPGIRPGTEFEGEVERGYRGGGPRTPAAPASAGSGGTSAWTGRRARAVNRAPAGCAGSVPARRATTAASPTTASRTETLTAVSQ